MLPAACRSTLRLLLFVSLAAACAPAATRDASRDRSTVTAKDLAKYPHDSIERVIQRMIPGVSIARTADGNHVLQIRGASSVTGETKPPLYVLNGFVISTGPDGELTGVERNDIESIKVLKGPDAAIYGIDGAHGVIVFTTKLKGSRR